MVQFFNLFFIPLKSLKFRSAHILNKVDSNVSVKKKMNVILQNKCYLTSQFKKNQNGLLKKNLLSFLILCLSLFYGIFFIQSGKLMKNKYANKVYSYSFFKKPVMTKIKTIPVFSVTNRYGQPFLIQNADGEHVGLIFFSHFEALEFGKELEKSHQATNPRIFIMGLDKAIKMVSQGATSSGIKDRFGQDIKMRFQFIPDQTQIDYAINLTKNRNPQNAVPNIPLFTIPGLNILKGKERITPMFFSKEDLDLAWKTLRITNPDFDRRPEIIEGDFIQLIFYMKNNRSPVNFLLNFGFVPSKESLAFVKKEIKNEPSARMVF